MNFINNWSRPLELAAGALSCPLDLPDGEYRLTVADAPYGATRWEILGANVAAGEATLERGLEGTDDQEWPAGSVIYCSLTAGHIDSLFAQLEDLQQRVAQLEAGPLLSVRLTVTSGVDPSSYRWLYRVVVMSEATEVAVVSAEELAALNGYYYNSEHWSGAPAAALPSSEAGDYVITTGLSVAGSWTHLALEWGGDLPMDSSGETLALADSVELGRTEWAGRDGSFSYADRYIDLVPLGA